ncbi:MAG: hypothetical protein IPO21_05890 [Bacteroidales bacterium]|nr:hypothetical protein [Bacteroidales bacterium]
MDPAKKNWLNRLVEKLEQGFEHNGNKFLMLYAFKGQPTVFVNNLLHASGLQFGYTDQHLFCDFKEDKLWSIADHIKVALTECLISIYLHHKQSTKETIKQDINDAIVSLYDFYKIYSPTKLKKNKSFFGVDRSPFELVEYAIKVRISDSNMFQNKYWKGSIFNTFVFLDLPYYSNWLNSGSIKDELKLEDAKTIILKTIIAAGWCNGELKNQTKILLNYFASSAILSKDTHKEINFLVKNGLAKENINYPKMTPIFKEIIVKSALITILADRTIEEKEQEFLDFLLNKLELTSNTLEENTIYTQAFLFKYYNKVTYLKNQHSFEIISKVFTHNFSTMIKKNRSNIIEEVSESKELVELLWKAKNQSLTPEEKEKVKRQLTDILRTIPSFAIFIIPGGSVILPIILKILPDELLIPSSFRN